MNLSNRNQKKTTVTRKNTPRGQQTSYYVYYSLKAVVKYVGGFWPIGVFFAGYRSFFFVPSRQTQTKARL